MKPTPQKSFAFFTPESMDMVNWQAKAYANADIPEWCGLFGAEIGLRVKGEQYELNGRLNKVWTKGDLPKMEVSTSACLCLILAWEICLQEEPLCRDP